MTREEINARSDMLNSANTEVDEILELHVGNDGVLSDLDRIKKYTATYYRDMEILQSAGYIDSSTATKLNREFHAAGTVRDLEKVVIEVDKLLTRVRG